MHFPEEFETEVYAQLDHSGVVELCITQDCDEDGLDIVTLSLHRAKLVADEINRLVAQGGLDA